MSMSEQYRDERIWRLERSRRFWKWLALGQLALLALAITSGIVLSTLFAVRAAQESQRARMEMMRAEDAMMQAREAAEQAEKARRQEAEARQAAEEAERRAKVKP